MKKRISSPDLVRTNFGEMPVQASVTSDDVVTDRQRPRVTRSRPPDVKHAKPADRLQLFQALIEGAKDYGIFMLDPEGFILTWNEGASRLKGYSESEILGRHFSCFYTADDVAAGRPEDCLRIARAEGKFEEEGWRVRQDGSRFWASILITTLYDKNGNPRGFSKLTRDNTERKRADERVLHSECSLRLLADSMPQIMWTARPNGEVDYVNQRWYEFTGSVKEPTPDELWEPFLHPDDVQSSRECWLAAMNSGNPFELQSRLLDRASGEYRWYLARALPLRDAAGAIRKWIGTATDIDEHKRLSRQLEQRVDERTADLQQMLAERTLLLKEVHHRVKNNLQVICSLLSMQIDCSGDEAFSVPLKDAHSRVLAMSLVHEKIYRSETIAEIDFGEYIEVLSNQLFSTYCVNPSSTRLETSVDTIYLTMHQAIPCGLILNELLSNSLKHAFGDGREGVIRVSLRKTQAGCAELAVADNGIGLPPGFQLQGRRSFGMQVVDTLIRQLRGSLSITGEGGATFTFGWKLLKSGNLPGETSEAPGSSEIHLVQTSTVSALPS
jgi:PAS domain S-box-containing protein